MEAGRTLYLDEEMEALASDLVNGDVCAVVSIDQCAPGSAKEDGGLELIRPASRGKCSVPNGTYMKRDAKT